jgi:hypothetical protein
MDLLERVAALTARERALIDRMRGGDGPVEHAPDKLGALIETTRLLTQLRVPHALIGGVAVGLHTGVPRATLDTDFAIDTQADQAGLATALEAAGYRLVGRFAHSLNFRHASGEPVQLAFDPHFDPMIARASSFSTGGEQVPLVRKEDLIAMKERAAADPGRRKSKALRDRADIELLLGDISDPDEGW